MPCRGASGEAFAVVGVEAPIRLAVVEEAHGKSVLFKSKSMLEILSSDEVRTQPHLELETLIEVTRHYLRQIRFEI